MRSLKVTTAVMLGLGLTACGSIDTAMRNTPFEAPVITDADQTIMRNYDPRSIRFMAPETLNVSEGTGYYPLADVVWRGDPVGDRVEQIGTMFQTAFARNQPLMDGVIPVDIEIELARFHGVTERTRFSVGGVYNIKFYLTLRNAFTGEVLEDRHLVVANLSAPGGAAAILADRDGQTEKVRVTDFLTQVLHDHLTGPVSL